MAEPESFPESPVTATVAAPISGGNESTDAPRPEPEALHARGCIRLLSLMVWPAGASPVEAPNEWPVEFQPFSTTELRFIECEHALFRGVEFGPFSLVTESHSHATTPQACRTGDYYSLSIMTTVLVSDPELADAVAKDWNLSVEVAAMSRSEAVDVHSAEWDHPPGTAHHWSFPVGEPWGGWLNEVDRLVVFQDPGLLFLDFRLANATINQVTRPTWGAVGEPHYSHRAGVHAGTGSVTFADITVEPLTFTSANCD